MTEDEAERMVARLMLSHNNVEKFAEELRAIRITKGLTQTEVAERMSTFHPNLNKLENRIELGNPTIKTLINWCHALGLVLELKIVDQNHPNDLPK